MVHSELTFELFCELFDTNEKCTQALYSARWPEGFRCPRCSHENFYLIRTRKHPLFECRSCHVQTSATAGTIMENSRTPLILWFQALFLHSQPRGISATRLSSIIGTTYKTAWLICHKIRHAMSNAESSELLFGVVRVNWAVYGHPYNPTVFRHPQEQPLLAGASIDEHKKITHLKIMQVPDQHLIHDRITPTAGQSFITQYVDPSVTDINVITQKFSRNRHFPLIQMSIQASNWINFTFNGIGSKHLQSYLDQFCYAFNSPIRNSNRFSSLLLHSATTPALNYPTLIGRTNNSNLHKRSYIELLKNAG